MTGQRADAEPTPGSSDPKVEFCSRFTIGPAQHVFVNLPTLRQREVMLSHSIC